MTPRQRDLLNYLRARDAAGEVPPTLREMAAAIGSVPPRVHLFLKALQEQGHVRVKRYGHRSVELVGSKLTPPELAWCERNVGRVRAAMQMDARGVAERRAEGRVAA